MHVFRHADTDSDIERCYATMAELRPHVARDTFVAVVRDMQAGGYRLAWLEDAGQVVAVAGYRISSNLHLGRNLYVDDLVTSSAARSKGYGAALLGELRALATAEGCRHLHLDSGTQRHRAHRFYFREGLTVSSFHFGVALD